MTTTRPSITRRAVLRGVQAAALGWATARLAPLFAAPRSRWFKIGACEWCLGKRDPAVLDVAKKIGLDGVQVDLGNLANDLHLRRPDVQKAYLDAAKRTGLEIGSLAISATSDVPLKHDPRAAVWLAESIDVCKAMGLRLVMPGCFYNGDLDMAKTGEIDHLVQVLRNVCPKAEKAGITIGLESYLSAEDCMKIVDRVGSPAMKIYYDVGNSTDKGRDVLKEIPLLGKLICEFHFKDAAFRLGQGRIDFKKVRKAIDQIDYSGWIHIEADAPHGVVQDYAADYRYLRGIFPERH